MTWTSELIAGHAGYLVGLVPATIGNFTIADDAWRPLRRGDDAIGYLRVIQVGCSCGWRSERLEAPIGTGWRHAAVEVSEFHEAEYRKIWRAHAIATVFAKEAAATRA